MSYNEKLKSSKKKKKMFCFEYVSSSKRPSIETKKQKNMSVCLEILF